jgi:hypothetical protein
MEFQKEKKARMLKEVIASDFLSGHISEWAFVS